METDQDAYQTASIIFACVMIAFGIMVTMANIRLSRLIRKTRSIPKMIKVQKMLNKSRRTIKIGKLSPIETILLATEAGLTVDQIRAEYSKEKVSLQETLENIFGSVDHNFFDRLKNSSRFVDAGYANQSIFLELNKYGSWEKAKQQTDGVNYELCKTQSMHDSYVEKPKSRKTKSRKKSNKKSIIVSEAIPLLHCTSQKDDAS